MMNMQINPVRLSSTGMRVLRHPIIRLIISILFFIAFAGLAVGISAWIQKDILPVGQSLIGSMIQLLLMCSFVWAGYMLFCAAIEGRRPTELDLHSSLRQVSKGILLGFVLISLVVLVMWITGCYRIIGVRSMTAFWPIMIMSVQAGIVEEIMSRGIIFRITEDGIGTWGAILFSAFIFGFLHIWNPNATVFSCISIALTAGVILGMLYVITRNLWVPIGMHIGWNLTLGGIYGAPVSEGEPGGLLIARFSGPDWLTGGSFGPEASVITVLLFLVVGAFMIRKSVLEKRYVRPMWRRQPASFLSDDHQSVERRQ